MPGKPCWLDIWHVVVFDHVGPSEFAQALEEADIPSRTARQQNNDTSHHIHVRLKGQKVCLV